MYFETHNHSYFSYLDGVSKPKDMAKRAKELGYSALALTDHGVIDGWYEFYTACNDQGIQPILSCEFYVAQDREDKEENPFKKGIFRTRRGHLIIHPKGPEGLKAIRELYNESWVNYKDQGKKQIIYEEDLHKYAGKILLQSACTGSYVDTEEKVIRLKKIFGDDLYLEIQPHKLDFDYDMKMREWIPCDCKQLIHNSKIITWARTHDVHLIVTGDAHYPKQEDKILQDILILNSIVGRNTGWCFKQDTNFLMDGEEWWKMFSQNHPAMANLTFKREDYEKSLESLQTIAQKTKGLVLEQQPTLRKFDLESHPLYKSGDTREALIGRIIKDIGRHQKTPEYTERLKYELKIIRDKGFLDYFLIQEDIIRWNRNNGFLVGPARGSAAGCLLAYYMDVTKVDPIKYGLLFERFLDLSRNDFPDIDIDYEMKEETVEYISDKYGAEFVMAIGAYQTIKIKTAIKQAYKILYKDKNYEYSLVNRVTNAIPDSNARGEGDQINIFKELLVQSKKEFDHCRKRKVNYPTQNLYAFLMDKPDLVQAVGKLLGKVTNMRVHPCSIVISDQPVKDVLPVTTVKSGTSKEKWVTAFDGKAVEASGYLKFDILGLKTLNCIGSCLKEIKKYKGNTLKNGIDITDPNNIWEMEPDDPKVFEKMALGDTDTVFQFNTDPLKRLLVDMVAGDFNDLVATVALIRPGPLKAGFPRLYVDRKFKNLELDEIYVTKEVKGKERQVKDSVPYGHPFMDEILKDTYNVITYQEQVQKIFVKVGGFTPIESNSIRKAISKGIRQNILDSKPQFLKYATEVLSPSWTPEQVDLFYEDMIGFGSYCFNLSHSVSYAFLGYVCQYLKTYYPLEWWSGNLEHAGEKGLMGIIDIVRKGDLAPLRSVDVNESKETFYYNGKEIIMPLKYIEGVGDSGLGHIIKGQPFTSLEDFVKRMPGRSVRKNCVISLIVSGGFDSVETKRSRQELLQYYLKDLKKLKEIPAEYQILIDDEAAMERKQSGVDPFFQSNWVEKYKSLFDGRIIALGELDNYSDDAFVFVGGEIVSIKYITVKKGRSSGQKMANIMIRQVSDTVKVTLWPNLVAKYQELLDRGTGSLIEVKGKVGRYNNNVQLIASGLKEIKVG